MTPTETRQRTTQNSRHAGTAPGISAIRRSTLADPRPSFTFGSANRPSNIFRQVCEGAPSISANLMSNPNPRETPRDSPPLKYVNPNNNQEDSDNEDGLPRGGPEDPDGDGDPNGPDNPDGDDDPDGGPKGSNHSPEPDPSRLFLNALHDLLDSLRVLRQPQAPKTKKIKVHEPDTFDGTNARKL